MCNNGNKCQQTINDKVYKMQTQMSTIANRTMTALANCDTISLGPSGRQVGKGAKLCEIEAMRHKSARAAAVG